jgi:acid stress chaperone HdeB
MVTGTIQMSGANMLKVLRFGATGCIVASTACLSMLCLPATLHAQVTVDITKITCRQFLIGRTVSTKSIAIWFSGYYTGKRGATMIDVASIEPNADKVQDYCGQHQDETLMKAVQDLFGVK